MAQKNQNDSMNKGGKDQHTQGQPTKDGQSNKNPQHGAGKTNPGQQSQNPGSQNPNRS